MTKLYEAKNNDYGDSVSDTYKKFGMDAFLVRMYDKLNRAYTLNQPENDCKVEDEKLTDTLMDLANYAILAMIELEVDKENLCCEAKEPQILLENDYIERLTNNAFKNVASVNAVPNISTRR